VVALQILAAAGVASRRAAEEIITAGRVSVNDKIEALPQRKVVPGKDKVRIHAVFTPSLTTADLAGHHILPCIGTCTITPHAHCRS